MSAPDFIPADDQPDFIPAEEEKQAAPSNGLPEGELPLDSYANATLQGLSNIGGGAIHAVHGMGHALMHPIDTAKSLLDAPGQLIDQAKQVPGAIKDINQSPDPTGAYLKVAGDTSGEGAGQAIVGAATPELPGMAKDAIQGIGPKTKALAKVAGQDAISRVPVAGRLVRRPSVGDYIDAARTKAPEAAAIPTDNLTPIQRAWKARGGTLAGEREIQRYPRVKPSVPPPGSHIEVDPDPQPMGEIEPLSDAEVQEKTALPDSQPEPMGEIDPLSDADVAEKTALPPKEVKGARNLGLLKRAKGKPVAETGEALATIKAPEKAAIPTSKSGGSAIDTSPTPKKVGDLLNEGLGGKSLLPNVPLRDQVPGKLPAGHSAVESSAIKSYKYDPATKEFEFVTPSGAHYVHGDVSPEQMADFEKATSKGKAFNEIKKSSTYVGKIVNGKRVNVKPPKNLSSASPEE